MRIVAIWDAENSEHSIRAENGLNTKRSGLSEAEVVTIPQSRPELGLLPTPTMTRSWWSLGGTVDEPEAPRHVPDELLGWAQSASK